MLPLVSKRWETIWFLAMGVCINYCIRVNVSIAAQEMEDELNWTEQEKGEILSAFFWGYASGQIPATLIAGSIGPKYTFGFAIFGSSVINLFMPMAAKQSIFFGSILSCEHRTCLQFLFCFLLSLLSEMGSSS